MRYHRIKQRDITDCGAACLTAIAAYYNLLIPVAKVRQYACTDQRGTTLLGLINAANKIGLEARGVRADHITITRVPLPAIAHLNIDSQLQHYIVIHKINRNHLTIMDPSDGKIVKMKLKVFEQKWTGVLLLVIPTENFQSACQTTSTIARFWFLLKPHRGIIVQILFGAIIYTLLGLSTSVFIQHLTDDVLVNNDQDLLVGLTVGMIVVLIFQTFLSVVKNLFILQTGQKIDAKLMLGYYQHLLTLPQSFFDSMRTGELISRVNDALKIRAFINDMAVNVVVNLLMVIFSIVLMFTSYWKLALLLLIIAPIYLIIFLVSNQLNKKFAQRLLEQSARLETHWIESLTSVATIKKFRIEKHFQYKAEQILARLLNIVGSVGKITIYGNGIVDLLSRLLTILLLAIGAKHVINKDISPGQLFSFYALIQYFTGPILTIIASSKNMQDANIAADRLFEIMDLEPESEIGNITLDAHDIGDIHFQEVCFAYGTKNIFQNLSFEIEKGSFTAIVGESGSGKSTIMELLLCTHPIQHGRILIGHYSLDQLCKESLRKIIASVPQKIHLFAGNLVENIAVGDENPDYKRIVDICTDLGMHTMIEALPQGLHTYLGENGALLSGGQRQRIAIARALYQNPEILILDEATSSLDSIGEEDVRKVIDMLLKRGKTVIVVAHRLSTIQLATQIVVLNNGTIVESGTHEELIDKKSTYHRLWQKQFPT